MPSIAPSSEPPADALRDRVERFDVARLAGVDEAVRRYLTHALADGAERGVVAICRGRGARGNARGTLVD